MADDQGDDERQKPSQMEPERCWFGVVGIRPLVAKVVILAALRAGAGRYQTVQWIVALFAEFGNASAFWRFPRFGRLTVVHVDILRTARCGPKFPASHLRGPHIADLRLHEANAAKAAEHGTQEVQK